MRCDGSPAAHASPRTRERTTMGGPCFLPIQTSRLVLRRMHSNDADRFAEYRAAVVLARYQGWGPISPVDAVAFIAEMRCAPSFVEETWL